MPFTSKEYANKYMKKYYSDPERRKKHVKLCTRWKKKRKISVKKEIFKLLGNRCSNPNCSVPNGMTDFRALQIDHIKGNGNKERKSFSNYAEYLEFVLKEIKAGSEDYQLLCANCNWIKRCESEE